MRFCRSSYSGRDRCPRRGFAGVAEAGNDPSALGALRAFEETGRGQNAEPEAREELRAARTRLVASVGYFPEKYGDSLLPLAFDIPGRKPVAPAVFTNQQIITPDNVDHCCPNDSLPARA